VGWSERGRGHWVPFLYSGGVLRPLRCLPPGGVDGIPRAINDRGEIIGQWGRGDGSLSSSFFYSHGVAHDIRLENGHASEIYVQALNNRGQAVGRYTDLRTNVSSAFLYSGGRLQDLNRLIPEATGWKLQDATDINDAEQIVGYGQDRAGATRAFLLQLK